MARPRKETQQEIEQEPQTEEVAQLNKDGLVPGQLVDWATLVRIEAERKAKNVV